MQKENPPFLYRFLFLKTSQLIWKKIGRQFFRCAMNILCLKQRNSCKEWRASATTKINMFLCALKSKKSHTERKKQNGYIIEGMQLRGQVSFNIWFGMVSAEKKYFFPLNLNSNPANFGSLKFQLFLIKKTQLLYFICIQIINLCNLWVLEKKQ